MQLFSFECFISSIWAKKSIGLQPKTIITSSDQRLWRRVRRFPAEVSIALISSPPRVATLLT